MQVRSFLLTLGVGMLAGGAVALMLPQQSPVRQKAQQAVDSLELTNSASTIRCGIARLRSGNCFKKIHICPIDKPPERDMMWIKSLALSIIEC